MFELRELNLVAVILRVLLSLLIGGFIGKDRGRKNRPAGLRTYMLVCLGACVVMMTNQYVYQIYRTGDPVRMGAQVVSGIGFLGAGTIIVTQHNQIKGLTTAAGLWASATIGLAIGVGLYEVGIISAIAVYGALTWLHGLDHKMRRETKIVEVYVELEQGVKLSSFFDYTREHHLVSSGLIQQDNMDPKTISFTVTLKGPNNWTHDDIMRCVRRMDGIEYIEAL